MINISISLAHKIFNFYLLKTRTRFRFEEYIEYKTLYTLFFDKNTKMLHLHFYSPMNKYFIILNHPQNQYLLS